MCFRQKVPNPPPVPKAPTRGDAALEAANKARVGSRDQTGAFGNIFTSVLGDSAYGQNAKKVQPVATLGGSQR